MKYVKLIAKPETWFKSGTEVYSYDCDWNSKQRISLDEWNKFLEDGYCFARGVRVASKTYENSVSPKRIGEEYIDGEYCMCEEFNVEIVDSSI